MEIGFTKAKVVRIVTIKNEFVAMLLVGVSVVFGVLIAGKMTGLVVTAVRADMTVDRAVSAGRADANEMTEYLSRKKAAADKIKAKNLFVPFEPKQHPVKQVSGILGSKVLIKGKWYKVGEKIGDAVILAIEPTQVKIEWDGKEKFFAPMSAISNSKSKKIKKAAIKKAVDKKVKAAEAVEEVVEVAEEGPLAWMGVEMSAALRAKLVERWNSLTDEQKQQMKDGWNMLSDDQKQSTIEQMEQNIDQI